MKSAISETGKKVGSFIEEKIKPSEKPNPRYKKIQQLVLDNNWSTISKKNFSPSPTGYSQFTN